MKLLIVFATVIFASGSFAAVHSIKKGAYDRHRIAANGVKGVKLIWSKTIRVKGACNFASAGGAFQKLSGNGVQDTYVSAFESSQTEMACRGTRKENLKVEQIINATRNQVSIDILVPRREKLRVVLIK